MNYKTTLIILCTIALLLGAIVFVQKTEERETKYTPHNGVYYSNTGILGPLFIIVIDDKYMSYVMGVSTVVRCIQEENRILIDGNGVLYQLPIIEEGLLAPGGVIVHKISNDPFIPIEEIISLMENFNESHKDDEFTKLFKNIIRGNPNK